MADGKKAPKAAPIRKKAEHDLAQLLYLHEGLEVAAIAERMKLNNKTIYSWLKKGRWDSLRAAQHMGKANSLERLQMQLAELNGAIGLRAEGFRFPDAKEADIIKKLTASIRDLETKLGLRELIDVGVELVPFVKLSSPEDAKLIKAYLDKFIQHKMSRQ